MQILVLLLVLHGTFVTQWVLMHVFNWYLADYFRACISYHHALGIEFVYGLLSMSIKRDEPSGQTAEEIVPFGLKYVFMVWLLFGVAWLLKGINF